jgi:two-component system, cell cycle response regulator
MKDYLETTQMMAVRVAVTPKVLIVDDDPLVCERLKAVIAAAGFQVRSVSSGPAALAALRKQFASIVITDRHMPDMDGLTLCRTIRDEQFDSYVYVILLTVQDSEDDLLGGLEAGADDYLSKRVSTAQLLARLRTAQRILSLEHSLRTVIEEKNRLATTDALTGAANRRYFTRHMVRELERARRFGGKLCLLLLDIDNFKKINDRYGHAIGDEVLQEFARRISMGLPRKTDWYARLGGEEFAVVLPETDLAGAAIVAERMREGVADITFATSSGALAVTVSVGVSGIESEPPGWDGTLDDMLDSADRCLYRSKEAGRNRVTVGELLSSQSPQVSAAGS